MGPAGRFGRRESASCGALRFREAAGCRVLRGIGLELARPSLRIPTRRLDARPPDALAVARVGDLLVTPDDVAFADADGVVFVAATALDAVLGRARLIWRREREQAQSILAGHTLREQMRFQEYLEQRRRDPSYSLRKHLQVLGGAIEA